jgi:hypothetical protein
MCSCPDAFLSLRSCAIEIVGVSGSLPVFGVGTVLFAVQTSSGQPAVVLVHDCLLSQGSSFNLLSVSQFQSSSGNTVDFTVGSPMLRVATAQALVTFPLTLHEGLYSFCVEPLLPNDDRYRTLPRYEWTLPTDLFSTARGPSARVPSFPLALCGADAPAIPSSLTPLGTWTFKLLVGSTPGRRILTFPFADATDFDAELRSFCDGFLSPIAAPPARKTYDPANPIHMADLSTRFMGAGAIFLLLISFTLSSITTLSSIYLLSLPTIYHPTLVHRHNLLLPCIG